MNGYKQVIANLQELKNKLKNEQVRKEVSFREASSRTDNEPPKTFVGKIEGNRIDLFRVSRGSKVVKPVLHKLEALKSMMQDSSYNKEPVKSITLQLDLQFPKQQNPANYN